MKKTFFTGLLTAVMFAASTTPATAAKPSRELAAARVAEAKKRYIDRGVGEFRIGLKIINNRELSPEQVDKIKTIFGRWADERLVPFLIQNDIIDDWIEIQFDADVLRLHREALEAKTIGDVLKITQESNDLMKKRWPKVFDKLTSPEGALMLKSLEPPVTEIVNPK